MPTGSSTWRDEAKVAKLRALWLEGLSATQIAERLGDVSRNAVIGKVNRMGLKREMNPASMANLRRQRQRTKRAAVVQTAVALGKAAKAMQRAEPWVAPPEAVITPPELRKTFDDLKPHECKYPYGSATPYLFCGRKKVQGLPYCEDHARLCFVPNAPKAARPNAGRDFRIVCGMGSRKPETPATAQPREKEEVEG